MYHRPLTLPSSKSKECTPWLSGALQIWQRKHSLWKWNPSALSLSTTNTRFLHAWHTSPRLWGNSFFKEGWGKKEKNWSRLCRLSMLKPTVIHVLYDLLQLPNSSRYCIPQCSVLDLICQCYKWARSYFRSTHRSHFSFYIRNCIKNAK